VDLSERRSQKLLRFFELRVPGIAFYGGRENVGATGASGLGESQALSVRRKRNRIRYGLALGQTLRFARPV